MNRRQQKKSLKRLIGVNLNKMGWSKLPRTFLYNTDHIENMTGITGEYRGRKFTIFDCGRHPCAYVDTTDCVSAVRDRLFIGEVEITFDSDSPGAAEFSLVRTESRSDGSVEVLNTTILLDGITIEHHSIRL